MTGATMIIFSGVIVWIRLIRLVFTTQAPEIMDLMTIK
jgi:hypothetical protein